MSLIGPNGSGKTTLFNCVTGYLPADGGRVLFRGQRPDRGAAPPRGAARPGPHVPARERVRAAQRAGEPARVRPAAPGGEPARPARPHAAACARLEARGRRARARTLLDLVGLGAPGRPPAGSLSYGQRKLLAFAATLMPDPELLLLDEPAAAINPTMINQMKEHILALNRQGKTVLLVEHNMDVVMDISRAGRGARPRPEARRGAARGHPPRPAGHRGVLWPLSRAAAEAAWTRMSAGYERGRGAPRRVAIAWRPGTSCRSSAPTAPASPPCSAPCSAWCGRARAASGSAARRSAASPPWRCSAAASATCRRAVATFRR